MFRVIHLFLHCHTLPGLLRLIYSVAVCNDHSPQELLAELQPEQRPLRNRNVSITYSHNVVHC